MQLKAQDGVTYEGYKYRMPSWYWGNYVFKTECGKFFNQDGTCAHINDDKKLENYFEDWHGWHNSEEYRLKGEDINGNKIKLPNNPRFRKEGFKAGRFIEQLFDGTWVNQFGHPYVDKIENLKPYTDEEWGFHHTDEYRKGKDIYGGPNIHKRRINAAYNGYNVLTPYVMEYGGNDTYSYELSYGLSVENKLYGVTVAEQLWHGEVVRSPLSQGFTDLKEARKYAEKILEETK